ncbi:hypothetical protein GCM10022204_26230 [Microlunatus aurantiacus]|uniref:Uncharacterized protein n=1 Tax=Microlunatus aurantiacus TaxID=446786 RepID=A0ABP7DP04_9ACTN
MTDQPPPAATPPAAARPGWTWARVERTLRRARTWVLAYLPDQSTARRPPVRIRTDTAVPGVVVRLAVVALGLLCASLVVTGPPGWVVVTVLLVIIGIVPGTLVTGVLIMVLGLLMVFDPDPASPWRTPLLVAGVPLLMQLATIAGQASWLTRIELRVLELPLRRYLAIQLFAQLLALTGGLVEGLGLVVPQVMALAAVALLALLVFWLPSLGPSRRRHD